MSLEQRQPFTIHPVFRTRCIEHQRRETDSLVHRDRFLRYNSYSATTATKDMAPVREETMEVLKKYSAVGEMTMLSSTSIVFYFRFLKQILSGLACIDHGCCIVIIAKSRHFIASRIAHFHVASGSSCFQQWCIERYRTIYHCRDIVIGIHLRGRWRVQHYRIGRWQLQYHHGTSQREWPKWLR